VNAADAFVGVVARFDKTRDLCVDFIVEGGEGGRREFCTTSVLGELWAGTPSSHWELTAMRCFDHLAEVMRSFLSLLVVSSACQL
jgi:hypothetical protein